MMLLRSAFAAIAATLFAASVEACAQGPERLLLEIHIGAAGSTPLVKDSIVRQASLNQVIGTGHTFAPVTARSQISPTAGVTLGIPLRTGVMLETNAAATLSGLQDVDGSFVILNGGIAIRYALEHQIHVRGGFGAIRYGSLEGTFLSDGTGIQPYAEAGAGIRRVVSGLNLGADVFAQVHTFGTTPLRNMGGSDGRVVRGGVLLTFSPLKR